MKKLILFLNLLFVGISANAQYTPSNNLNYVKLLKVPPVGSVEDSVLVYDGSDSFIKMRPASSMPIQTAVLDSLANKANADLAGIVEALGYTPENTANKQNSLALNGTGALFPTVDAVNGGLSLASKYDWFTINATKRQDYMLQREYNTNRAYTALTAREVNLSQSGDTYGHGAIVNLHFSSTKLYVVSIANTTDTADNATSVNVFVRLQILQGNTSGIINMPILSTTTIAKFGDVVGGKTIISGAGVPNAFIIGDILHMIWSAQGDDGVWYTMHNTVNCLTDVIGTPEICTMESGLMNSAKIASHLGRTDNAMVSMNGTITAFGGYYYSAAVCFDLWKKGAILRTTDFVNWEFVIEPVFTGISPQAQWEISMGALGSNLYMAIRQSDLDPLSDVNSIILAKLDASCNVLDWIEVPSGTSRPEFYLKGTTELYLVFPTNNRTNSVLLQIDPVLRNSRPVQDIPVWGNYVSIAQRGSGSSLQFAVRTSGSTGLRLSSMNANNISSTTVMTTREYISTLTSDAQTQFNAKAPLASPALTGTPTAPTATAGTSTTQIATTAFTTTADNLKANISNPTFTTGITTPALNVSGQTASTVAIFDASKNIISASTATYPNLTELSHLKGATGPINTTYAKIAGNQSFTGAKTFENIVISPNLTGTTPYKLFQQIGLDDYWSIYGQSTSEDHGIMVFEVGDNGASTSSNGQTFQFRYTASADGVAKTALTVDYNVTTINGVLNLGTYTVSTLPTPTTSTAYATVTDATSPTYLSALTGGGSVVCPVFYNGTIWVSH